MNLFPNSVANQYSNWIAWGATATLQCNAMLLALNKTFCLKLKVQFNKLSDRAMDHLSIEMETALAEDEAGTSLFYPHWLSGWLAGKLGKPKNEE